MTIVTTIEIVIVRIEAVIGRMCAIPVMFGGGLFEPGLHYLQIRRAS